MSYISLDIEWWKMKVCVSLLPLSCSIIINDKYYRKVTESENYND